MGEVQGYLLIITLIYVAFDKRLAVQLSVVVTLAMCLNHLLKILVKNPRPFIAEGDYLQKSAVPLDNARELATEWSTPSGHAMAGASFYGFLYGRVRSRCVRSLAVLAILLTGASRPYLGVHYVEDILLGWAIGLGVGWVALRHGERIAAAWGRLGHGSQIGVAVVASLIFWLATLAINGGRIGGQPRAFLGYAGILTGIIVAWPAPRRLRSPQRLGAGEGAPLPARGRAEPGGARRAQARVPRRSVRRVDQRLSAAVSPLPSRRRGEPVRLAVDLHALEAGEDIEPRHPPSASTR